MKYSAGSASVNFSNKTRSVSENEIVTITVDMDAKTMSVMVGNEDWGVAFDNLPEDICPCIGSG